MKRPPVIPRAALRLLLPRRLHEAIAGDLEEQWHDSGGSRGRFWTMAARSIVESWRERLLGDRDPGDRRQGGDTMRALLTDVRYGLRMMRRNPGFSLAATLTLAIGIGSTVAIFSLVNTLSFKPLAFDDPSRVAFVFRLDTESGDRSFSLPIADLIDLQRHSQSLEASSAYVYLSANLTGGDLPERVQAYRVTPNTFDMLGVPAALGRTFSDQQVTAGGDRVAVISHGLWTQRFGADPSAIGRTVVLNGASYEIVGVMPRRFEYPVFNFKGDIWVPWTILPPGADRITSGAGTVVARIRRGVTLTQAEAELRGIMQRLGDQYPATNGRHSVRLVEMRRLADDMAGPLNAIMASTVAVVLLLACANVANLLLARGVSRSRELAIRGAVGASRGRLVRQLLVESLLLTSAGAVLALALALVSLRALKQALPEMLLRTMPNVEEIGIDATSLAFTVAATLTATVGVGLLPAWRASRSSQQAALKEGSSSGGSRATRRLRTTLVIAEVALATLLVITATLLVRGYVRLQDVSPGFSAAGVLTMAMTLPEDRYPDAARRRQFYEQAADRVGQLPGLASAAFVNVLPFSTYNRGMRLVIDGEPLPRSGSEPETALRVASPGYFDTLRIPLRGGRAFDGRDTATSAPVGVVNSAFARRFLGNSQAVGRRVRFGGIDSDGPWITIVGTVGDVHHAELTEVPAPELYVPLSQASGTTMMMLAVRVSSGRPEDHIAAVRGRILEIDPLQPVYHVKPMTRLVEDSLLPRTMAAATVGIFSVVALILAMVGVYGVVSYAVTQQMPEFGVRLALGATPADLTRLVMRRSAAMMSAGLGIGTAAAAAASALLENLLYGVSGVDPVTYVGAVLVLTTIGLSACLIPAWRASSAEPLSALRAE